MSYYPTSKKSNAGPDVLLANLKLGEMRSVAGTLTDDAHRIDAGTMTVFDNGDRIVFGGTSRMVMQTVSTPSN